MSKNTSSLLYLSNLYLYWKKDVYAIKNLFDVEISERKFVCSVILSKDEIVKFLILVFPNVSTF